MKLRALLQTAISGFVSAFLLLFALLANDTKAEWFTDLVCAPGHLASRMFLPAGTSHKDWPFVVEFVLDLFCIWLVLLFVVSYMDKLIFQRKGNA
jgi:hypothetical protein